MDNRLKFINLVLLGFYCVVCLGNNTDIAANRETENRSESDSDTSTHRVRVADAFIDLHTGPGRSFPKFYSLERHQWLLILKRRTDWFLVRTERGIEGWASIATMRETLTEAGAKLQLRDKTEVEFRQREFETGFQFGEFEGANTLTLFGGWRFTENMAAEFSYEDILGHFSDGQLLNLSLTHSPFPEWPISPFFALGAGIIKTTPFANLVQTEDREDNATHVGAGLHAYITRSFVFRMDYKHYVVLTSRNENENVEEWKLGFSVFF